MVLKEPFADFPCKSQSGVSECRLLTLHPNLQCWRADRDAVAVKSCSHLRVAGSTQSAGSFGYGVCVGNIDVFLA